MLILIIQAEIYSYNLKQTWFILLRRSKKEK